MNDMKFYYFKDIANNLQQVHTRGECLQSFAKQKTNEASSKFAKWIVKVSFIYSIHLKKQFLYFQKILSYAKSMLESSHDCEFCSEE